VAFILIGYAAAAMLADADHAWTGLLLGTATALLAAGTRSGWPLAGAIGGLLAARIVSRAGQSAGGPWFWGGFAGPFVLLLGSGLFYVPQPGFDQWHLPGLDSRAAVSTVTVVASSIALAAIGYGAERAWVMLGPRMAARLYVFRPVVVAGAIGIALTLAASAAVQLPVIPPIEGLSPDLRNYVGRVLLSVLTIARVSGADFFAWTSFLGAFGWLDTLLPPRLLTGLTVLGSLSAIWLLVSAARDADGRRGAIAVLAGLGILASVAGCAIGSYGLNRNIHGRYLLGPYVVAIALLCNAPMLAPVRWLSGTARASALVVFVLAVHAIAVWVVLGRYFG
jgi:hypothetical protein